MVLTDRNEEVVDMLNQNIELNSLQGTGELETKRLKRSTALTAVSVADNVEGMVMKWVDDVPALKEKYPTFETIIGTYAVGLREEMKCCVHFIVLFLINSHAFNHGPQAQM